MKVASTARRIFDPECKKTFTTVSAQSGPAELVCPRQLIARADEVIE
jgi:hypothetical protein